MLEVTKQLLFYILSKENGHVQHFGLNWYIQFSFGTKAQPLFLSKSIYKIIVSTSVFVRLFITEV